LQRRPLINDLWDGIEAEQALPPLDAARPPCSMSA
jgi:hypothetical protein